jgi:hypothetical protein
LLYRQGTFQEDAMKDRLQVAPVSKTDTMTYVKLFCNTGG